jgi:hypothetical protein
MVGFPPLRSFKDMSRSIFLKGLGCLTHAQPDGESAGTTILLPDKGQRLLREMILREQARGQPLPDGDR